MTWLENITSRFAGVFRKRNLDEEMSEELHFHLEMQVEDNIRWGMTPEDARFAARRSFGGLEQVKEEHRDRRSIPFVETLMQDLRYGARTLRRSPGFATVAVLTLALGIGANTAIFSVVNSVLLRSLSYPNADRLVTVCETSERIAPAYCIASPGNVADWERDSQTIEAFGLARNWPFSLQGEDGAEGINGGVPTPGVFDVFGARMELGRTLAPGDTEPGFDHVVLLSYGFWQSHHGGDRSVLGESLMIDKERFEIVGVLSPGFEIPGLEGMQIWIPMWAKDAANRDWRGFQSFARLGEGVGLDEARAEMKTIRQRLVSAYPEVNDGWDIALFRLHDRIVGDVRPALLVFLGAVGFLLLIACANVANLLLVREAGRQKEFAIRAAMGARRWRLLRLLWTESLLLALLGGIIGWFIVPSSLTLFKVLAPDWFPRMDEIIVDQRVLWFTVVLSVFTSFVFGLGPAIRASRLNLNETLKDGQRWKAETSGLGLRGALIVAEIALSLTLLIGAGLLVRGFATMVDWQPGFDRENLLTVWAFSSQGKSPEGNQVADLFSRAREELAALPSVTAAGLVSAGPLFGGGDGTDFVIEGRPAPDPGSTPSARFYDMGPNYFQTMGIHLVRGRLFDDRDNRNSSGVAIINESMARRYWPDQDPIGQRIAPVFAGTTLEVIGVVGDVRPFQPGAEIESEIYWLQQQFPRWATYFVIRTEEDRASIVPAIQRRLEEVDPDMQVSSVRSLDEYMSGELVNPRFNTVLLGTFAGVAFSLALIGIYSVVSFSVSQRTHEFGVRMALGAKAGDISRMMLGKGMALTLMGVALGLAGALALTRFLESILFGVTPTDPLTFATVAAAVVAVSLLACYVPARRATRVDPMVALRHE